MKKVREDGVTNLLVFFLYFVVIFNPQKSLTLIVINGTNERVTCRFGFTQTYAGPKSNRFQFFEDEKNVQNFVKTNFKHFNIYRDEKYILFYKCKFSKISCRLGFIQT